MRRGRAVRTAWRAACAGEAAGERTARGRMVGIGLTLLPAALGSLWLRSRVAAWEAAGEDVAAQRLFAFVLATTVTTALLTALSTMQRAIGGDGPLVLLTLPLTPLERLWIAALRTFGDWRSMLAMLGSVAGAVLLVPVAPLWALALVGSGWLGTIVGGAGAIWGVVAWTRLAGGRRLLAVAGTVAAVVCLIWAARRFPISAETAPIAAGLALDLPLIATLLLVGPAAPWLARAYDRAVQGAATPSPARDVRPVPGVGRLARRPGAVPAMIAKDLATQARDPLSLLRVVVTAAALPAYGQVRELDAVEGWPDVQLVACFAAALTVYSLVDSTPSPIGAEGERLSLWWIAPAPVRDLLLAKLLVYLVPALVQGIATVSIVGVGTGMSTPSLVAALALVTLLVAGPVAFLILMSASDLRLDVPLESGMPTSLHEHVPHTPRRLALLNVTILLLVLITVLVWRLPLPSGMPLIAAVDAAIALACWRAGMRFLRSVTSSRPQAT